MSVSCLLLGLAWGLPQQVALFESFDQGVPPSGWSEVQNQPQSPGWSGTPDGRACHLDGTSASGPCDDELRTPLLDLRGFAQVHAHFACELNFADYLANHPNTSGDGETDLLVRVNGGAWIEAWTETRTGNGAAVISVDLTALCAGAANVELSLRYYGTFAHATWFDWLAVGDDPVPPPPPPPPPVAWSVNLPSAHLPLVAGATGGDDFEIWGGVLPQHMAVTSVDPATGLPAADGHCTIAGGNSPAASGVRCLEMGLAPGSGSFSTVRNALVLGLDGTGSLGVAALRFQSINFGDELQAFDGVWLSADGLNWSRMYLGWGAVGAAWSLQSLDLRAVRSMTRGTFYLMFGQEDNFPYATTDGIGVDDLAWDVNQAAGPTLSRSGACPGTISVRVDHLTAGGNVLMIYGAAGSYVQNQPSLPCFGISVAIAQPRLGGILPVPPGGTVSTSFHASTFGCGLTVQAVDLATCRPSNTIAL